MIVVFGAVQSEQKWLIIIHITFSFSQYLTTQILHSHSDILVIMIGYLKNLYWIGSPVIPHGSTFILLIYTRYLGS